MYRVNVVRDDPLREGLVIAAGMPGGDGRMQITSVGPQMPEQTFVQGFEEGPTPYLPYALARPLTDALVSHYGAAGDVRELRRDYEAERARVNKLIDALIAGVARP